MSINPAADISGGTGDGGSGGPCGACKFLRRKCIQGCIFAPYFDSEQGAGHFSAVHKVFGASNVSKLLLHIPVQKRLDAVVTICYEAQARLRDPVYGCVAHIFALQQQVVKLQAELSYLQAQLATLERPSPPPLSDATSYDLSTLFDPVAQSTWTVIEPHPFGASGGSTLTRGGSDLQALSSELLKRHDTSTNSST